MAGTRILPGRKGKEKEVELPTRRRWASTVEYGDEESEDEEYGFGRDGEEVVRVRRERLGGSISAARRRLPTRTIRRASEVEKAVLDERLEMSMREVDVGSFPSFNKESWKAGLEGSDAELELEESSEEEEEMEAEEELVKSMWSSAGGLFGDVGVRGGEPTLAFAPTTQDDNHADIMANQVLGSFTAPPPMSLEPTPTRLLDSAVISPQPVIVAPVPPAPPSTQKNRVVWREGPARKKRRLEGSLGGGAGDSQSPMSDPLCVCFL